MENEEIITKLNELVKRGHTKSQIEIGVGMPKNSLATILSGNKPMPPKWAPKLADYLLIIASDVTEQFRPGGLLRMTNLPNPTEVTFEGSGGAEKGQEAEYMASPLEPIVQAVNLLGGPEVFHKKWCLREDLEAMDDKCVKLMAQNKALKDENERLTKELAEKPKIILKEVPVGEAKHINLTPADPNLTQGNALTGLSIWAEQRRNQKLGLK